MQQWAIMSQRLPRLGPAQCGGTPKIPIVWQRGGVQIPPVKDTYGWLACAYGICKRLLPVGWAMEDDASLGPQSRSVLIWLGVAAGKGGP